MGKKKKIYWVIAIIILVALFFVISHYTGFIDFKELFVAGGDPIPMISESVGLGGVVG